MKQKSVTINTDTSKICSICKEPGVMESGLCIKCATAAALTNAIHQAPTGIVRFKKIKLTTDGKTTIAYERKNKDQWDEYTITSADAPRPELPAALDALAKDVIEMCELPPDNIDKIHVKGVTFSYGGDRKIMGATITAQKTLLKSHVPLNLNTPHKAENNYSGQDTGETKQLLTGGCIKRLTNLKQEAHLYLNGQRAQQQLL